MTKLYKNLFVHNTIGHPLMAIFQLIGLASLAAKIHDETLPKVQQT